MMTARQMDRAVNAALARIMPPMVRALRDDLVAALREELAGRDAAPAAASPPADATRPHAWVVGQGAGRRLTEAGEAELKSLAAAGTTTADIARVLGITKRAVNLRLGQQAETGPNQAARDAARAEAHRAYQREWRRCAARWARVQQPAVIGVDHASKPDMTVLVPVEPTSQTVAVVPASVVPAPRQPPATALSGLVPPHALGRNFRDVVRRQHPQFVVGGVKPTPEVITTTTKEVRAWLIASLKAGGLTQLQAMDRVGFMTHDQALAEANQRRTRAGYPPFAFPGAQRVAGSAA